MCSTTGTECYTPEGAMEGLCESQSRHGVIKISIFFTKQDLSVSICSAHIIDT